MVAPALIKVFSGEVLRTAGNFRLGELLRE
jgi:hypothetical protein